ncbi:uncharacterized protein METZ01_LOCUS212170, partial [marine metagenome]
VGFSDPHRYCSYLFYYGKNVSLPIEVKQKLQSCTDDKNRSLLGDDREPKRV